MNCVSLFFEQSRNNRDALALFISKNEHVTFGELADLAVRARKLFLSCGIRPGDSVLLMEPLGVRLYACVIGLLSLGATLVLVEPWMSVKKIQNSVELTQPKLFISNSMGFLWGSRIKAVRRIRRWIRSEEIDRARSAEDPIWENVDPAQPAIVTFTSGTTGIPKGVVRTHGYLLKQRETLSLYLDGNSFTQPDLCLFANFALLNLASGRGSLLVSGGWKQKDLEHLDQLPSSMMPETMTVGPGFLLKLMDCVNLSGLKSIHVGGALTDCWIFERGFEHWPNAHWTHIYGGSEVEPVAIGDARLAVEESRRNGLFQTLFLGKNIPETKVDIQDVGLWVAGPHVCGEYLGSSEENRLLKRRDADGTLWHFMGDRIEVNSRGWWFQGRSTQPPSDFLLEQNIYQELQSSKCFVVRRSDFKERQEEQVWLVGEGLLSRASDLRRKFPELAGCIETGILRDRRHRARIDRSKTLLKGAPWLTA